MHALVRGFGIDDVVFKPLFSVPFSFPYLDEIGLESAELDRCLVPRKVFFVEKIGAFEGRADDVEVMPLIALDLVAKRRSRGESENQVLRFESCNDKLLPPISSVHMSHFEGRRPAPFAWFVALMERVPELELAGKVEVAVDVAGGEVLVISASAVCWSS